MVVGVGGYFCKEGRQLHYFSLPLLGLLQCTSPLLTVFVPPTPCQGPKDCLLQQTLSRHSSEVRLQQGGISSLLGYYFAVVVAGLSLFFMGVSFLFLTGR